MVCYMINCCAVVETNYNNDKVRCQVKAGMMRLLNREVELDCKFDGLDLVAVVVSIMQIGSRN